MRALCFDEVVRDSRGRMEPHPAALAMDGASRMTRYKRYARDEEPDNDGIDELCAIISRLSTDQKERLLSHLTSELEEPGQDSRRRRRPARDEFIDGSEGRGSQYKIDGELLEPARGEDRRRPAMDSGPRRPIGSGANFTWRFPDAARIKVMP
jgi:hypothetical protein